jgi:hypothetical protein
MASARMLRFGATPVTGEQIPDCRDPPVEGQPHPVAKATMTPNEKEPQVHLAQREERQLLELVELQKRMFRGS